MHNQTQNADGSTRFIQADGSKESLRLTDAGGAEFYGITFTIGAEAADVIRVTCQLTDRSGKAVAKAISLHFWPAAADGTKAISAVTSRAVVTGLLLMNLTGATQSGMIETVADGTCSFDLTVTGAGTRTFCIRLPDGRVIESATITWAA